MTEMNLPWNYHDFAREFVKIKTRALCLESQDVEFLIRFGHDPKQITALTTDSRLKDLFAPMGVIFKESTDEPETEGFDLILCRHSDYDVNKIHKALKKGGHFITEQVGPADLTYPKDKSPSFNLENQCVLFKKAGFKLVKFNQFYREYKEQPKCLKPCGEYHRFILIVKKCTD